MKKILLSLTISCIGAILFAQAPQSFKYQTIVRDAADEILDDQNVYFKISILQYTDDGSAVYVETFDRTTNDFGLVTFNIGEGDAVETGVFEDIDWSDGPYFVKVEVDIDGPGSTYDYEETGTSELLSVPYALHSKTVHKLMNTDPVTGDIIYYNGTEWVAVSHGEPGQFLQLQTTNLPEWSGPAFATLTTDEVTNITATTATSGGNITDDGGGNILERGVCWSTDPNPTISDSKTSDGTGTGTFISDLTGLTPNTTYYVRAYATNWGTGYGNEVSFTTLQQLILWNKLGSDDEVTSSEIGEDGTLVGTSWNYETAQHGNGYVRTSTDSYVKFPKSVLQNLRNEGTLELWVNPKVTNPVPYSYGAFMIVGYSINCTNAHVYIRWGDGTTGLGIKGGVNFDGTVVSTPDESEQFVATIGTPFHLAVVWNVLGIEGSDQTVRVYRDGVQIGSSTTIWNAEATTDYDNFYLGTGPDGNGYDKYIVDNIKVWDSAKTDFSDRFTE